MRSRVRCSEFLCQRNVVDHGFAGDGVFHVEGLAGELVFADEERTFGSHEGVRAGSDEGFVDAECPGIGQTLVGTPIGFHIGACEFHHCSTKHVKEFDLAALGKHKSCGIGDAEVLEAFHLTGRRGHVERGTCGNGVVVLDLAVAAAIAVAEEAGGNSQRVASGFGDTLSEIVDIPFYRRPVGIISRADHIEGVAIEGPYHPFTLERKGYSLTVVVVEADGPAVFGIYKAE